MARLLGSGSKGRTGNAKLKAGGTTPPGIDMLRPQESGAPDVVHDRVSRAVAGRMQSKQLKSNKSTGLRVVGRGTKSKGNSNA